MKKHFSLQQEEILWERAEKVGMSRREFLRLLGLVGSATFLAACGVSPASTSKPAATTIVAGSGITPTPRTAMFFKSEEPLLKIFATELGARWDQHGSFITPTERFFVRNRYPSPDVNVQTWRLKVTGDAIERPLELTYDELLKLPSRKIASYLECFGNGRTLNWEQLGYDVKGGNWGFSAISMGEWDYIPLAEILARVKPKKEAVQLLFWSGLDGPDTGRPIPMEEILARPEVIGLAYGLNGQALARDHGFPVRALVPGWGGAANVKWLTEISISTRHFWTRMHTKEEALVGPDYSPEKPDPNDDFRGVTASDVRGTGATWQNVKSFLTVPLVLRKSEPPERYPLKPGELPTLSAGQQTMHGYASSPWGIAKVEYSIDAGSTWQEATLVSPSGEEYTWTGFEFPWEAKPGTYTLMTKATDKKGNTQPETIPFNEMGILCNAIPKFELKVS